MKKTINLWQWLGFIITGILGVVLHFLYDWLGQNPLIALISGVNESTWEHMKLLYYPMLIFSLMISAFQLFRILRKPSRTSKEMTRYMLRTAIPLLPHSLSVALGGQADKLFVTRLMGAASLAKYAVVHSLGIALQFAVTSLGSALGPWIIRRLDLGEA